MFGSTRKESIKEATEAITPVVDTVELCGRQNILFRGHRDSTKDHPEVGQSARSNSRNLVELLMYRVREGEKPSSECPPKCKVYLSRYSK